MRRTIIGMPTDTNALGMQCITLLCAFNIHYCIVVVFTTVELERVHCIWHLALAHCLALQSTVLDTSCACNLAVSARYLTLATTWQ